MTRFSFELEPVLRLRLQEEREKQRAVAEIEMERRRLEDHLRSQQAHVAAGKRELRDALTGALDMVSLREQARASIHVERHGRATVMKLAGLHQRMEKARAELIEATRARRAMELLREKRLAVWQDEQRRLEQNTMDELAVQRAARREMHQC